MDKAYASLFSTVIVTEAEPVKVLALTDLTHLHEAGETGTKKSHWISYLSHRCDKAPNRNNLREEKGFGAHSLRGTSVQRGGEDKAKFMAAAICVSDSWNLAGPSHVERRQFSVTLSVFLHQRRPKAPQLPKAVPAISRGPRVKPHGLVEMGSDSSQNRHR